MYIRSYVISVYEISQQVDGHIYIYIYIYTVVISTNVRIYNNLV